ncbi:MATE family efflux transporter [Thiospirochaeta perfilievii]|uniref:MATE family efflux transporter n=2 Tax=Thiospirochaeta perfilievii TaxID=252967 RepID=A0A5C1Q9C7_9SPIO|nr:MATE family efflux transporter [Thiospirochaeta perfilievii]
MYSDQMIKEFIKRIFAITVPVTLQNLLGSSRNLVDTMMIGTLGVVQVAAVGAAGKPFFVMLITIFGITNGAGILISQYWGKRDADGVAKNVLVTIIISISISTILVLIINIFSLQIVGFSSSDESVIKYGSEYLRIISTNLILQSVIISLNVGLRSTGQVKKCTLVSLIGVTSNIVINYILIFGKLGFDPLGLRGAALGTLYSCIIETFLIVIITLFYNNKFRISISKFINIITMEDFKKVLDVSIPLAINSFAWAGGTYVYFMIYGRIGSEELAIMTMLEPLSSIMISFFSGLATGTGILLGHSLGVREYDKVWREANYAIIFGVVLGVFVFTSVFLFRDIFLGFFTSLPPSTLSMARFVYLFIMLKVFFMSYNIVVVVGILRSGGDTKYVMFIDMFCQWAVGIPLCFIAAFILHLPLHWVALFAATEEFAKLFLSTKRLKSKKWIRTLIS